MKNKDVAIVDDSIVYEVLEICSENALIAHFYTNLNKEEYQNVAYI